MDAFARNPIGGATSIPELCESSNSRGMGTSLHSTHRREVDERPAVAVERPRCLHRVQESAQPEPRKARSKRARGVRESRQQGDQRKGQEGKGEGESRAGELCSERRMRRDMREPEGVPKAPGEQASTVHGDRIWSAAWSSLLKCRGRLTRIFYSIRSRTAQERAPKGVVWPLPLPFPEVHVKLAKRGQVDFARKLGVNFLVLCLNNLVDAKKHFSRVMPSFGTALNREQWAAVRELAKHVEEWNAVPPITAAEMGRAAAKVEGVETMLASMEEESVCLLQPLRKYRGGGTENLQTNWGYRPSPGEVVGKTEAVPSHLAKKIEPSRLKFWSEPSFNALPFLDYANQQTFEFPLSFAEEPCEETLPAPRVSVRCAREDELSFLELLDSTGRLELVPEEEVRMQYRNGAFAIPKDGLRDRMVLDARPPNVLEGPEKRWIQSLGSISQFSHFFLKDEEEAVVFAEDLREFYHAFTISQQRKRRNAFKLQVTPSSVQHLRCFKPSLRKHKVLIPCLNTMAMGDLNAVSYGQTSHLSVILQSGALVLEDFLALRLTPPRRGLVAGLMIDDFLIIDRRKRGAESTEAEEVVAEVVEQYERVGLPRHAGKAVSGELQASFWGSQFDGKKGELRPSLTKAIPLASLTLELMRLGLSSVSLLEVLGGSFVACLQYRRRLMSCMEEIFAAQRMRDRKDLVRLSLELHDELATLVALLPLCVIDLRLQPSERLYASDASGSGEAAVYAEVGEPATEELQFHGLQKGVWNKLLSPYNAYCREKGLEPEDLRELPGEEEEMKMHPVWEEIVSSQTFFLAEKPKKVRSRRHINVGEVSAALRAEDLEGQRRPGSYFVSLQDSQVALACLCKGRSSSRALNELLRSSLPSMISSNIRGFYGYVRSKKNPADDPTQGVKLRPACRGEADWMEALRRGETELLDEFLAGSGHHRMQLSGLPDQKELLRCRPLDLKSGIEERRERRKEKKMPKHRQRGDLGEEKKEEKHDEKDHEQIESLEEKKEPEGSCEERAEWLAIVEELEKFPEDQFIWHQKFGSRREALLSGPGLLDLFAGSRGISKAFVEASESWSLTFDIKNHPREDLLSAPLQVVILNLLTRKAFCAMASGPVCASFSTAITPPVRSLAYPEGVPWCSDLQKEKNCRGNDMLKFVLKASEAAILSGTKFFVENPDGSWLWRQKDKLSWDRLNKLGGLDDFRTDYCRFGTPWRKRTKFKTNLHIGGQRVLCKCSKPHIKLRGRCKEKGCNYTQLAEPYPKRLEKTMQAPWCRLFY